MCIGGHATKGRLLLAYSIDHMCIYLARVLHMCIKAAREQQQRRAKLQHPPPQPGQAQGQGQGQGPVTPLPECRGRVPQGQRLVGGGRVAAVPSGTR
eukprot:scaffold70950_cov48-Phaeocystis_antarctica.AAC.1